MASTYSLDDLAQLSNLPPPPPKNMFAAARFICNLFESNSIPSAIMGGFSLRIRGSERQTKDVDIIVRASMRRIWEVIEREPKLMIFDTRTIETTNRVFVCTGPSYEDHECDEDVLVEVDIIQAGPPGVDIDIAKHRELLLAAHEAPEVPPERFQCLNLAHLMRAKMHAIRQSDVRDKDLGDLIWLLDNCAKQIPGILEDLVDTDCVTALERMLEKGLVTNDKANAYAELLGVLDG